MPKVKLPLLEQVIADAQKPSNGKADIIELPIKPVEPPRVVFMGSEVRYGLAILVGDQIVSPQEFSVTFQPVSEEGMMAALREMLKTKEDQQAKVTAEFEAPK